MANGIHVKRIALFLVAISIAFESSMSGATNNQTDVALPSFSLQPDPQSRVDCSQDAKTLTDPITRALFCLSTNPTSAFASWQAANPAVDKETTSALSSPAFPAKNLIYIAENQPGATSCFKNLINLQYNDLTAALVCQSKDSEKAKTCITDWGSPKKKNYHLGLLCSDAVGLGDPSPSTEAKKACFRPPGLSGVVKRVINWATSDLFYLAFFCATPDSVEANRCWKQAPLIGEDRLVKAIRCAYDPKDNKLTKDCIKKLSIDNEVTVSSKKMLPAALICTSRTPTAATSCWEAKLKNDNTLLNNQNEAVGAAALCSGQLSSGVLAAIAYEQSQRQTK